MQETEAHFKKTLLQTYNSFKSFCAVNNLKFVAAGGTALGVVRHKGLIPWDDDIDVYMLRTDYNRFLALKESLVNSDYEIVDPRDKNYHCMMAKYVYRNSTLWEFKDIPCPMGVYIDVFALDYETGKYEDVLKRRLAFNLQGTFFCISAINRPYSAIFGQIVNRQITKGFWYLFQKCLIRPLRPYFRRTVLSYPVLQKGEWLVALSGASGKKDVYKAEWFDGVVSFPFEDSSIDMPIGYDAYLRHMYGDYNQLPPKEKRVSHHPHFYLNLDRRISTKEIQELLKK